MGLLKTALIVAIAAFIIRFIFQTSIYLGYYTNVHKHQPGPCQFVSGIEYGSEDIQATSDGLLFVTSGMGHLQVKDHPNFKKHYGQIMLIDTNIIPSKAVSLPIEGALNRNTFSPHGLSLWKDPQSGELYIYVVSHPGKLDTVEKFLYSHEEKKLTHITTFKSDLFGSINDLVAVGLDQFYITNMVYSRTSSPILMQMEFTLGLSWAWVGYFDGKSVTPIISGLGTPNGINISPDRKFLYVALMQTNSIGVYKINNDHTVSEVHNIPVGTSPDNIDVDLETGDLFVGCHPINHLVLKYLEDPKNFLPPSQVLRLQMSNGIATDIEEMYSENGNLIFGASVAVYRNKRLFIGTVHHKMAECEVKCMS